MLEKGLLMFIIMGLVEMVILFMRLGHETKSYLDISE